MQLPAGLYYANAIEGSSGFFAAVRDWVVEDPHPTLSRKRERVNKKQLPYVGEG